MTCGEGRRLGPLRRLVPPVAATLVVLAVQCRPEPDPYLITNAELNGILGDVGRAAVLLLPQAEGWRMTASSTITNEDGRSALLRIHGSSFASATEASGFYRSVAESYAPPRPAGAGVIEARDFRESSRRPSAQHASWRARLLRVERHVALVEVSTPVVAEVRAEGPPSGDAMADGDCETILTRVAELLQGKLVRAAP